MGFPLHLLLLLHPLGDGARIIAFRDLFLSLDDAQFSAPGIPPPKKAAGIVVPWGVKGKKVQKVHAVVNESAFNDDSAQCSIRRALRSLGGKQFRFVPATKKSFVGESLTSPARFIRPREVFFGRWRERKTIFSISAVVDVARLFVHQSETFSA